jgi:hypothetical protein
VEASTADHSPWFQNTVVERGAIIPLTGYGAELAFYNCEVTIYDASERIARSHRKVE